MWTFDPLKVGRIPPTWRTVIETVRSVAPNAVIAGGALRDLALGGEPRDLDVFIPAMSRRADAAMTLTAAGRGWTFKGSFTTERGYGMSVRAEVTGCDTYSVPGLDIDVQLILTALPDTPGFPLAILKTMDFDLCRVAHDGDHPIFEAALLDAVCKPNTMTLVHCPDAVQAARSLKRGEKFRDRYPGLVVDNTLAVPLLASTRPVFCEFGI